MSELKTLVTSGWSSNEHFGPAYVVVQINRAIYDKIKKMQQIVLDGLGIGEAKTSGQISVYAYDADFCEYYAEVVNHETSESVPATEENAVMISDTVLEDPEDYEGMNNIMRTDGQRMVVSDDDVLWYAHDKYGGTRFETLNIQIKDLDELFAA